jgi:hypothetical protein
MADTTAQRRHPDAHSDNTAPKGLRERWATPPRSGLARSIAPWEYRHLRVSGVVRGVCGLLLVIGGILFLSYGAYAWAAAFLVVGTLNIVGFFWYLSIARSQPSRA